MKHVTYKNKKFNAEDVIHALHDFDEYQRDTFAKRKWRIWGICKYGRVYPPKEILRIITKLSVEGGGIQINRLFKSLGFKIISIKDISPQKGLSGNRSSIQRDALDDLEYHRSEYENETEKDSIIKARIGQGKFRESLIKIWGHCAVTGCKTIPVLRASHIKSWRDCDNRERLDRYNGLLLVPNIDVLFDGGYISFGNSGEMLISDLLSPDDLLLFGLNPSMKLEKVHPKSKIYLNEHRLTHGFKP